MTAHTEGAPEASTEPELAEFEAEFLAAAGEGALDDFPDFGGSCERDLGGE